MSKKLVITGITKCRECAMAHAKWLGADEWDCSNQPVEFRRIPNPENVPEWCPLPDEVA